MRKSEIILELLKKGLVVVVRGNTVEEGVNISKASIQGGIKAVEVAYTNPNASTIIKQLNDEYEHDHEVIVGAGTVLDAPTARMAILAGAQFIVSPSFDHETAVMCNRYAIPYIPGCMTLTEIVTAMESGVEVIKLFPGSAFGPGFIKAVKSPLPHVSIMVTGGVNIDNINDWFKAGADAIGIGGNLNTLGEQGQFDQITEITSQYVNKIKEVH